MQHYTITKGATSQIIPVSVYDSSSTTGAKLAGLVYNSGSLTCYYNRMGAAGGAVVVSLLTATKGTWTTAGFVAVDGTNMPGDYELHIPDAALATGVDRVIVQLKGAANMVPCNVSIELKTVDMQDGVRAGLTALPNAAVNASNGLFSRGSGAGQINQDANGRVDVNLVALSADTTSVANLLKSAGVMLTGTVTTAGFSATSTEFETTATAVATAGHWIGRLVIWTSGTLQYQQALITAYSLVSGKGHFTVTTMTTNPANTDAFIIV